MHYHARAFSRNGRKTILSGSGGKLGQRRGFSDSDASKLNRLYGCADGDILTVLVPDPDCRNSYANGLCNAWQAMDGCRKYKTFMLDHCPRTCDLCPLVEITATAACADKDERCFKWALSSGDNLCQQNKNYMNQTCPLSCGFCRVIAADERNSAAAARITVSAKKLLSTLIAPFLALTVLQSRRFVNAQ